MGCWVGHENMGLQGVSSWMMAVRCFQYPFGNVKNGAQFYFKNIVHIVRNPFSAIGSIILENKHSPNGKSYRFRRDHIKLVLGIVLPEFEKVLKMNVVDSTELAIKTFLYWNKICTLCNPTVICQIENIKPIQVFNKFGRKLYADSDAIHTNKMFKGQHFKKPNITVDILNTIDCDVKTELKDFCDKYNYKYILDD